MIQEIDPQTGFPIIRVNGIPYIQMPQKPLINITPKEELLEKKELDKLKELK